MFFASFEGDFRHPHPLTFLNSSSSRKVASRVFCLLEIITKTIRKVSCNTHEFVTRTPTRGLVHPMITVSPGAFLGYNTPFNSLPHIPPDRGGNFGKKFGPGSGIWERNCPGVGDGEIFVPKTT